MPKRTCHHCGQAIEIPDSAVGENFACPLCGKNIMMPPDNILHREKIKLSVSQPVVENFAAPDMAGIARRIIANIQTVIVGKNQNVTVGQNQTVQIGQKVLVNAVQEYAIQVGKAQFVMKQDGTITLKGMNILLESSDGTTVKASGELVLKGQKVTGN